MTQNEIDVIVLGGGIVGVSAALHLQARGRGVVVVDRAGAAGRETSFGNTGIVQTEAIFPYTFPRGLGEIARAALNRDPRAHIRYRALGVALFSRLLAVAQIGRRDGDAPADRPRPP